LTKKDEFMIRPITASYFIGVCSLLLFSGTSLANSGESIYQQVCASCHTPGVAGAPKLGDKAKWAALIKEGQVQITAHGYVGVRGMPAKGGRPDLGINDFAASVVYMANQSGASWKNPDDAMLKKIDAEIQRRQAQLRK
jgi:mono/diheme cytochrome c family protein